MGWGDQKPRQRERSDLSDPVVRLTAYICVRVNFLFLSLIFVIGPSSLPNNKSSLSTHTVDPTDPEVEWITHTGKYLAYSPTRGHFVLDGGNSKLNVDRCRGRVCRLYNLGRFFVVDSCPVIEVANSVERLAPRCRKGNHRAI